MTLLRSGSSRLVDAGFVDGCKQQERWVYKVALAPKMGTVYNGAVRLISRKALKVHYEKHGRGNSKDALLTWAKVVEGANWDNLAELKESFPSADLVRNERVVFNIKGNNYRIVAAVLFDRGWVLIKFVGTPREYDRIDVATVELPE
ncbi:MAG: type II toxin-antitoxin system HigB family toxin [Candidatus Xenobia bacterium]